VDGVEPARRAGRDGRLAVQAARRPAAEPVLGALDVGEAREVARAAELAVDHDREADGLLALHDGADRVVLLRRQPFLGDRAVGEPDECLAQRLRPEHASHVVHSKALERHESLLRR
jgi:hypothetical protein